MAEALGVADTRRLHSKPQDLNDAYGPPSNFLEIDIFNPHTVGVGRAKYTTYEVRMRVMRLLSTGEARDCRCTDRCLIRQHPRRMWMGDVSGTCFRLKDCLKKGPDQKHHLSTFSRDAT